MWTSKYLKQTTRKASKIFKKCFQILTQIKINLTDYFKIKTNL